MDQNLLDRNQLESELKAKKYFLIKYLKKKKKKE